MRIAHPLKSFCILLFLCISLSGFNAWAKAEIEVIYNDQFPLSGVAQITGSALQVKLYNLDDARRLLDSFKKGLAPNGDLKQSKAMIMQRFNAMGKANLKKQFSQAYQGIIIGTQYGVKRFPVVLFDQGQSAVYGVTHLPDAIALYQQWKTGQRRQ